MNDTSRILESIRGRLDQNADPIAIVNDLTPQSRFDAVKWARRLPLFEEFAAIYGTQVVGLARIMAKRALREQGLRLTEDGRIVEAAKSHSLNSTSKPTRTFLLPLAGGEVKVEYTRSYVSHSDQDAFYFLRTDYERPPAGAPYSLPDGTKPHPLSNTGFLNQFADHDAVEACGGPQEYARHFASAQLRDDAKVFDEAFEGKRPEAKGRRKQRLAAKKGGVQAKAVQPATPDRKVVGEHTAQLAEEESDPPPHLGGQAPGSLF